MRQAPIFIQNSLTSFGAVFGSATLTKFQTESLHIRGTWLSVLLAFILIQDLLTSLGAKFGFASQISSFPNLCASSQSINLRSELLLCKSATLSHRINLSNSIEIVLPLRFKVC